MGSKSILHAIKEKLKIAEVNLPDDVIKQILTDVKQKHEETSKEEIREAFFKVKEELRKVTKGVSDKDFFAITYKYAKPYLSDEYKREEKSEKEIS